MTKFDSHIHVKQTFSKWVEISLPKWRALKASPTQLFNTPETPFQLWQVAVCPLDDLMGLTGFTGLENEGWGLCYLEAIQICFSKPQKRHTIGNEGRKYSGVQCPLPWEVLMNSFSFLGTTVNATAENFSLWFDHNYLMLFPESDFQGCAIKICDPRSLGHLESWLSVPDV